MRCFSPWSARGHWPGTTSRFRPVPELQLSSGVAWEWGRWRGKIGGDWRVTQGIGASGQECQRVPVQLPCLEPGVLTQVPLAPSCSHTHCALSARVQRLEPGAPSTAQQSTCCWCRARVGAFPAGRWAAAPSRLRCSHSLARALLRHSVLCRLSFSSFLAFTPVLSVLNCTLFVEDRVVI